MRSVDAVQHPRPHTGIAPIEVRGDRRLRDDAGADAAAVGSAVVAVSLTALVETKAERYRYSIDMTISQCFSVRCLL
jgi:hypothetical protein